MDEPRCTKVYGKACHRDAVRSTHSFTAYRWGHKWVVLAILVKFPFARRRWALPVLVALYRSPEWNRRHGRRHKTPSELMRQLLAVLLDGFGGRKFVFAGDGGEQRRVEIVSGIGHWYKNGEGLVPVRWVFVHDCTGTHRDEYFFTIDTAMTPRAIIETFTGRWSIETTFQEMWAYLGLETTRGWREATVLRAAPCLFGLFSVVAALYAQLPARYAERVGILWPGKTDRTFSDASTAVRRWLWFEWAFAAPEHYRAFAKPSRPTRAVLLYAVAPAA